MHVICGVTRHGHLPSPKVYAFPAREEGNPWPETAAHGKRSVGRATPYFHCPGSLSIIVPPTVLVPRFFSAEPENSPIAVGWEQRRCYSFSAFLLWILLLYFSGPIRFFESLMTLTAATSPIKHSFLPIAIIIYCFLMNYLHGINKYYT